MDLENEQAISDEHLDPGWYRHISANGDKMTTSPPGKMHCGTIYPIWLNGIFPTNFRLLTLKVSYIIAYAI